jgi:hypothetical protein
LIRRRTTGALSQLSRIFPLQPESVSAHCRSVICLGNIPLNEFGVQPQHAIAESSEPDPRCGALWFLEDYEQFELPAEPGFERVRRWQDACRAHAWAQPEGRSRFVVRVEPSWRARLWPPRDKYDHSASDAELGLV